jgi:hypothetical protein
LQKFGDKVNVGMDCLLKRALSSPSFRDLLNLEFFFLATHTACVVIVFTIDRLGSALINAI